MFFFFFLVKKCFELPRNNKKKLFFCYRPRHSSEKCQHSFEWDLQLNQWKISSNSNSGIKKNRRHTKRIHKQSLEVAMFWDFARVW